ncbi:MAG: glutathione S-transferase, partial [Solirubrobacteraceae bacterium]|nr:glutathione S-transferase [Solirubrobacteraceae bacterium]
MIGAIGVTLYMFSGSHSVLMAELMLRHKGIPYRRVNVLPGVHVPVLRFKRFPNTTVPAMEVDGRRIQGTLEISRELDRLVAEPRLFPLDPGLRAKVEAAERWGEDLQNESRRVLYCMARRDVRGFTSFITPGRARPTRWFLRATAAGLVKVAGSVHGASEAAGRTGVAALPGRIDQIDAWIAEGV